MGRHGNDGQIHRGEPLGTDAPCGLKTVHDRHLHIHQHQGYVLVIGRFQPIQGLLPVGCQHDVQSRLLQQFTRYLRVDVIVFHHQHRAGQKCARIRGLHAVSRQVRLACRRFRPNADFGHGASFGHGPRTAAGLARRTLRPGEENPGRSVGRAHRPGKGRFFRRTGRQAEAFHRIHIH